MPTRTIDFGGWLSDTCSPAEQPLPSPRHAGQQLGGEHNGSEGKSERGGRQKPSAQLLRFLARAVLLCKLQLGLGVMKTAAVFLAPGRPPAHRTT